MGISPTKEDIFSIGQMSFKRSTSCYGTRGRGLKFIGDQQEAKPDEDGQLAFRLFDRFMRAQRKTPAATTPPTVAPAATTPPTAAPAATTPPTGAPAATTPPTGAPAATTPTEAAST
ncbi:classical arabinogalactan protein 7 isoform X2 [Nematostella vectensis]|uniref:classical arabinogalactan protein 7 isoform X2 n=1 Tax=Nematostella vectensis TaxID=45351 RepID=UPI00207751AA|nr:classical arabinogalactan protein 7 isoform X2 [Nematostella vectensis]